MALSVTLSVAVLVPAAVGAKSTQILQVVPDKVPDDGHAFDPVVKLKSPGFAPVDIEMLEMLSVPAVPV